MKMLFVTCHSKFLDNEFVFPYLGVLYLLGIAAEKYKVKILKHNEKITFSTKKDYDVFYCDKIEKPLEQYHNFDFYCFSVFTPQYTEALELMKELKRVNPNSKFIIGGSHATYYSSCIKNDGWDLIVAGEGESVFRAILEKRIALQGQVINEVLSKKELEENPIPYREKEHLEQYKYFLKGDLATTLITSRGCPNKCAFCESRLSLCRRISPDRFRKEVDSIVGCGFSSIMIFDDIFAISPSVLSSYVDSRKSTNGKIQYRCFVHANIIFKNPDMIGQLSDFGVVEVGFGAESASNEILEKVGKGTTREEYSWLIDRMVARGIRVKGFFMLGLPGETKSTATETYDFIKLHKDLYKDMFDFDCTVFFPYKGTYIGDSMREGSKEFNLRLVEGVSWEQLDSGAFGAYKQMDGTSDYVVESFDYKTNKCLFSIEQINQMQRQIIQLSGRVQ